MRAPDDFPEASGDEVKSSSPHPPSPVDAVDGAKNEEDVNHSFEPPNTTERRTPPRPVYRHAAAAATATSAPPRPPMPPNTSSSRHGYYNPGYYAYGQYSPHYYHAAGYNFGHHHHHHPAGYRPTITQGKDGADVNTVDATPITPRDDDQLPPSVTMSPTPPASVQPQRRDDTGSNSARPSTPPPVSSEAIPDSDINDKDVLSGRGGGTNNHPGNKEFRSLVDQYRSEYVLSKKWAKRQIAKNIVESIRSKGGRFLKKEGGVWYDIGDQKARENTSQALREGLAAKMRAAYAESSGASTAATHQAPSTSQRNHPEPAPAEAPTPSQMTSTHHHEADYYHIPPHGYQHYSPDSVTGHVHPQSADYHLDPTSSASYEPYDYAHPYEYSPEAYGPPPPSSPIKRRRLSYSTYSSGEPKQTEAV